MSRGDQLYEGRLDLKELLLYRGVRDVEPGRVPTCRRVGRGHLRSHARGGRVETTSWLAGSWARDLLWTPFLIELQEGLP